MTKNFHARLDKLSKSICFNEAPTLNANTRAFLELISTPELEELIKFIRVRGIMSAEEVLLCGALRTETIKILKEFIHTQVKEQNYKETTI